MGLVVRETISSHWIGGNQKVNSIDERRLKIVRNIVFDCHLSAIENTVSSDI